MLLHNAAMCGKQSTCTSNRMESMSGRLLVPAAAPAATDSKATRDAGLGVGPLALRRCTGTLACMRRKCLSVMGKKQSVQVGALARSGGREAFGVKHGARCHTAVLAGGAKNGAIVPVLAKGAQ